MKLKNLTEKDIYTQELYNTLYNFFNKKKTFLKQLPEEGIVYVSPEAKISKRELKKKYPKLKQVYPGDTANIIILADLQTFWGEEELIGKPIVPNQWGRNYTLTKINNYIDIYNELNDKQLIDYRSINLNDDKPALTRDVFDNILNLLQSEDKELWKMGYKLLMNYDYEKDKELFFLCLAQSNPTMWWSRERGISTEKIIKQIKNDFKNIKF